MSIEFEGLTEFQEDLLEVAQKKLPKEVNKMMGKAGNRLTTRARQEARSAVGTVTGNYYKRFKRGKVFKDAEGKIVVRAINSAPHAHLIEYGHELTKGKGGPNVGWVPGKLILNGAAKKFGSSGDFEKIISKELDRMLDEAGL